MDANEHVIYVDDSGKLYDHDNCDLTVEPLEPIYTEDNLPLNAIPIYTTEQYSKISTGENDYEIKNLSNQSKGIFNMTNNATYVLMNDLDFTSISNLTPIHDFKGTFEGNRYTIKNIKMDTTDLVYIDPDTELELPRNGGIFDIVDNATISNLTVDNLNIEGPGAIGGLIGESKDVEINSCKIINSIITNNDDVSAGGLIGFSSDGLATISNSKVISTNISGSNAAGIVATSNGSISLESCRVEKVNADYAGFIGYVYGTLTMTNCKAVENTAPVGMVYLALNTTTLTNCESIYIDANISGIVYYSQGDFTATNCKVINSTIDANIEEENDLNFNSVAGIISVCDGTTSFNNCEVNRTDIIGNDYDIESMGGFAAISNGSTVIQNSSVTMSTLQNSIKNAAGMISIINGSITVDNAKIENVDITVNFRESYGHLAGLFSIVSNGGQISNTNVNNVTIHGKGTQPSYGEPFAAGLVSVSSGELNINRCNVTDTTLDLEGEGIVSGIVAIVNDNLTVDNCLVNNIILPGNYHIFGGIVSVNRFENVSTITNCNVQNITLENATGESAGICAIANFNGWDEKTNELIITNCNLTSVNITSESFVAGIIGVNSSKYLEINDCNVTQSTLTSTAKDAAGIITYTGIEESGIINDCIVNNTNITSGYKFAAGIAAVGNLDIKNCSVSKCNISFEGDEVDDPIAGGIVACSVSKNRDWIEKNLKPSNVLDNNNVVDTTITIFSGGSAGGIVGNNDLDIIQNCTVKSTTVSAGEYIGGIVGLIPTNMHPTAKLYNCKVENSTLINTAETENYWIDLCTGGIAGLSTGTPIDKCTVTGTSIISNNSFTGGIAGLGFKISDSTVTYSNIKDHNTTPTEDSPYYATYYGLGGIVGHGSNNISDNPLITNCKVLNSTLIGCDAVGGISGAASPNITSCEVSNTNITGVGNYIGGIQGFGGSLYEGVLALKYNNCVVNNSHLYGGNNVNYINGAGTFYYEGSTVPLEERLSDVITNCTYNSTIIH